MWGNKISVCNFSVNIIHHGHITMKAALNACALVPRHVLVLLQSGSYTNYFADALIAEAELDSRVVGIHAAMGGGTGMNRFEQRYPERTFDVGIAEQVPLPFLLPPFINRVSSDRWYPSMSTMFSESWFRFLVQLVLRASRHTP